MSGLGIDRTHQPTDAHFARLFGVDAARRRGSEHVAWRVDFHGVDVAVAGHNSRPAEAVPAQGHYPDLRGARGDQPVFSEIGFCPEPY